MTERTHRTAVEMLAAYFDGSSMPRCVARRVRGFAAAALSVGVLARCQPVRAVAPAGHVGADTLRVQEILKAALVRRAPVLAGRLAGVDPAELSVRTEMSDLIPGVSYHSTAYAPPQTADLMIEAFAAIFRDTAVVIEGPEDWVRILRAARWSPADAAAAQAACAEFVRATGSRRSGIWPATMYTDSSLLHSAGVSEAETLRHRLSPPVVQRTPREDSWTVVAWFLEQGQATQYKCRIGPGSAATRESVAEIPNAGYPRIGP